MAKKGSIVWSLKHRPPLSMSIIGSILLLLMSSKGIIIDNMPITNAETKAFLGSWYTYALEIIGVGVGIFNIFFGLDKEGAKEQHSDL